MRISDWSSDVCSSDLIGSGGVALLGSLFLRQVGDRDDTLAVVDTEERDAAGGAPGDADVVDRAADQLAGVGHQHDLVARRHRESGHHAGLAPARAREVEVAVALAPAPGPAVPVEIGRAP